VPLNTCCVIEGHLQGEEFLVTWGLHQLTWVGGVIGIPKGGVTWMGGAGGSKVGVLYMGVPYMGIQR
jgi:hypothetical protein